MVFLLFLTSWDFAGIPMYSSSPENETALLICLSPSSFAMQSASPSWETRGRTWSTRVQQTIASVCCCPWENGALQSYPQAAVPLGCSRVWVQFFARSSSSSPWAGSLSHGACNQDPLPTLLMTAMEDADPPKLMPTTVGAAMVWEEVSLGGECRED